MPVEKLVDLRPKGGLDLGLYPSAEVTSGMPWRDGRNAWFRELTLEHTLGRVKAVSFLSRSPQAMAQTFTLAGTRRLYFEDLGIVRYWEGGASAIVGNLATNGQYDFETWGDWLLATDNVTPLRLWKNTGAFGAAGDSITQFARCKIIKKLAQHVLVYCTDVLPTGFHWSSANNPELWTPDFSNSARNLAIRNLDSEIIAVVELGARHAVYSKNTVLLVQFVGPTQWFGVPNQALTGIGAVSKESVVALGNYNFGLSRNGIFVTDGNSFTYIDRPAIDKWVQETIDWNRATEVVGYWDERLGMVIWSVPLVGGTKSCIALDPKVREIRQDAPKSFSFLTGNFTAALRRESFDYSFMALPDGIHYASVPNTNMGDFFISSHLFDGGQPQMMKSWDLVIFLGHVDARTEIRLGFADTPSINAISWDPWMVIPGFRIPFGPRESVYIALEMRGPGLFQCNALTILGEKAGWL